jgi:hypothetical protein
MEAQTSQDKFQIKREAALVRHNQAKAQWSTDRMAAQVASAEAERIEAIREKILHTVAALFFLEKSIAVLQRDYDSLCKYADGSTWIDPRLLEGLNASKRKRDEFTQYLAEQSKAGAPFTAEDIQKETERFAYSQGGPERYALAATKAAKKIEQDAKPQVAQGKPHVLTVCEKCGADLSNPNLPLHLNGNNVWCIRDVRRAFATGRDAHWLLFEGNVTVEELQQAGITVPTL